MYDAARRAVSSETRVIVTAMSRARNANPETVRVVLGWRGQGGTRATTWPWEPTGAQGGDVAMAVVPVAVIGCYVSR
jgi:hypothetical protein